MTQGQLIVALDDTDDHARLAQSVAPRNTAVAEAQQAEADLLLTRAQVATETPKGAAACGKRAPRL